MCKWEGEQCRMGFPKRGCKGKWQQNFCKEEMKRVQRGEENGKKEVRYTKDSGRDYVLIF